jgi:hypothetical protein
MTLRRRRENVKGFTRLRAYYVCGIRPREICMNGNKHTDNDAALSAVLRDWRVSTALPPRFQEQVWQRIARREPLPAMTPWAMLLNWIGQAMARPSLAASYLTVLLAAGLIGGYWHAQLEKTRTAETLGSRYVQMVDPYQNPRR